MHWSHLAVFDLDRTLVKDNCSFLFCRYLVSKKILSRFSLFYSLFCYLRHLFFGMGLKELHQHIFSRLLKGRSIEQIEENVVTFLEERFFSLIYPPAFSRLRLAQHLGYYTLILSNSPSFLVQKIAAFIGVDESRSTEYGIDASNKLERIVSIMEGDQKALFIREITQKLALKKEQITAYSDSILDQPFLSLAGNPVAVNPDKRLKQIAEQNRWEIL